jgi:phosphoribosylamine--glycine ligase
MKVLVVGSGAREHALSWRLQREGADVLVAPGNGGTANAVAVAVSDTDGLATLAERERVDLTIVGPEAPLEAGIVDAFDARGLAVFGPTRAAARLEWSKAWTKDFLARQHIPTGSAEVVDSESRARAVIRQTGLPVVLKADGLAAGKGVFVVIAHAELDAALDQLFARRALGSAADHVLVEELLTGPELSVLAFSDGERIAVMPAARDYKRLLDGDRGPNTGGMGGYTRPSYASPSVLEEVEQRILRPALAGIAAEGHPYRGVLYAGLMLTTDGPKVIEFNCRFGDPECQLIMPLMSSSLSETCLAVAAGELRPADVRWADGRTYCVVLAAGGYPEAPQPGAPISGLADLPENVLAFHAGTRREADGRLVTAGGRVLTVVGLDRAAVYSAAETIQFVGKQFRRDIGRGEAATVPGVGSDNQQGAVSTVASAGRSTP